MIDEPLWVDTCPLCEMFTKRLTTKLYWPSNPEDVIKSEFIIVECPDKHIPMIVYRDHVFSVLSESWGKMLYQSKKIFGNHIRVNIKMNRVKDHWHATILLDEGMNAYSTKE